MNTPVTEMDTQPEETEGFSLTFSELRSMVFRQRYIMAGIVLIALVFGLLFSVFTTPIYQAEVKVQIDPDSNEIIEDRVAERTRGADVQRYLNSQIDIIKSRSMALRVANDLKLIGNDNFLIAMGAEPAIEVAAGESVQKVRRDQVVGLLTSNVEMVLPFGNKIATITFDSPSEKVAQEVVNAYAENLITGNIAQRYEATSYARDFLEQEINDVKQRLEDSERQALLYARNTRIIDASDGVSTGDEGAAPRSITTANMVQMNSDMARARTERILSEERWNSARNKPYLEIAEVIENPTIQGLQAEKAAKEAAMRELLDRYKPDHPVAQQSAAQIESLDAEIESIANNIRRSIYDRYQIALRQEQSLNTSLEGLKNDTLDEQNKRVELNLLAREVDTNRTQYQALLERFKEVSTSADIVTNNITIIDRAEAAEQIAPRPLINMLLAGFVGFALALFVAFLRETFDDSIRSPDDITRKLGLPLLGTTPLYDGNEPLLNALEDRKSAIAEAYASIRSSLDFSTSEGAPRSLLISSSQPSEGKSTTAVAIAESFGRAGKKVLLIDADLRNPSLHKYLRMENNNGFVATMTGNTSFDESVRRPEGMHFDFLSCGPIPPDPTEIIVSKAIVSFIEKHRERYDHIIFDGPPVMGLADSPQISRAVRGTLLVVEAGRIRGGQTKTAIRRLFDANATIVGIVLSKFDSQSSGYGEYYGYQYSYGDKESN